MLRIGQGDNSSASNTLSHSDEELKRQEEEQKQKEQLEKNRQEEEQKLQKDLEENGETYGEDWWIREDCAWISDNAFDYNIEWYIVCSNS